MALAGAHKLEREPNRLCWGKTKLNSSTNSVGPAGTHFPQRWWARVKINILPWPKAAGWGSMLPAGPVVARGN